MAENNDCKLTNMEHILDENENPSTLSSTSSISTVNDSFNLITCEADTLISSAHSTPKKNVLIESEFQNKNLEKGVLPDLVHTSLCGPNDNVFANYIHEAKKVSASPDVSFCSINDSTFNTCHDASLNISSNSTNNIALLFERLKIDSDQNVSICNEKIEHPPISQSSALPENQLNNIVTSAPLELHTVMPSNENSNHPNLNAPIDINVSKVKNLDSSFSSVKSLHQTSVPVEFNESKVEIAVSTVSPEKSLQQSSVPVDLNISKLDSPDSTVSSNKSLLQPSVPIDFNASKIDSSVSPVPVDFNGSNIGSPGSTVFLDKSLQPVAFSESKVEISGHTVLPEESFQQSSVPVDFNASKIESAGCSVPLVPVHFDGSNTESPSTTVSLDKSLEQASVPIDFNTSKRESAGSSVPHVPVDFDMSNTESPNTTVSLDKSLKQASVSLDFNASKIKNAGSSVSFVPVDFDESKAESPSTTVSLDQQSLHTDSNTSKAEIPDSSIDSLQQISVSSNFNDSIKSELSKLDCPFSTEASLDNMFKHPFPIPDINNANNKQNISDDNVFGLNSDDNFEGEEFQDAVQFFKDPSSFQAFEEKTSEAAPASRPRDSLYMTFDPFYKRVVHPVVTSTVVDSKDNQFDSYTPVRESLGGKLISFDSPIKIIPEEKSGDLSQEKVAIIENNQQLINEQNFYIPDQESHSKMVSLDSPMKNNCDTFDKHSIKDFDKLSMQEEIDTENNQKVVNKDVSSISDEKPIDNADSLNSSMKNNSEKDGNLNISTKQEISDVNPENNLELVNKHISNLPARESVGGNLLSFDSPMKSNSACNSESAKTSVTESNQKLYTEEEFQQALKIYELTLQEAYLKKQKGLEEDVLKKETKLPQMTELCRTLLHTVSEFAILTSEQNSKIGDLSAKVANLESENQKLESDLKTSTEDLQSTENTFSNFHKRYVECKDMLKTYKDNEDRLKSQVEHLNKNLEDQEQMYAVLQTKMGEIADKANAEVASVKKGGDAQVAVLKALLQKSELKVSSLESDLKQVRIENDKLNSICEDLMAKVREA